MPGLPDRTCAEGQESDKSNARTRSYPQLQPVFSGCVASLGIMFKDEIITCYSFTYLDTNDCPVQCALASDMVAD